MSDSKSEQDECGMGRLKEGPQLILKVVRADGSTLIECSHVYDSWDKTLDKGEAALVAMDSTGVGGSDIARNGRHGEAFY